MTSTKRPRTHAETTTPRVSEPLRTLLSEGEREIPAEGRRPTWSGPYVVSTPEHHRLHESGTVQDKRFDEQVKCTDGAIERDVPYLQGAKQLAWAPRITLYPNFLRCVSLLTRAGTARYTIQDASKCLFKHQDLCSPIDALVGETLLHLTGITEHTTSPRV